MTRPGVLGERTLALFFLGVLLFNPGLSASEEGFFIFFS